MNIIQYKGMKNLTAEEKEEVNTLSTEYYGKIKRDLQNITAIEVHVKTHDTDGKRSRYEVKARVEAPTRIFEASYEDWELAKALHKVFNKLENQIKKALKTDVGFKKPYS